MNPLFIFPAEPCKWTQLNAIVVQIIEDSKSVIYFCDFFLFLFDAITKINVLILTIMLTDGG